MTKPIVALVTGASRGIGREISRQLAARGVQVVMTARNPVAGEKAAREIGGEAIFLELDVTAEPSVKALAETVGTRFGKLDVLVNNAGIISKDDAGILEISLDALRQTLETNTLGPLRISQELAPLLRKSSDGRIVNISSGMGALQGIGPDHAAYRLSKVALNAVTGMLAAKFHADKIAVNSVCPGWVRTDMGGAGANREVGEGAEGAVWLALDAPRSLTGKFIRDHVAIPW